MHVLTGKLNISSKQATVLGYYSDTVLQGHVADLLGTTSCFAPVGCRPNFVKGTSTRICI